MRTVRCCTSRRTDSHTPHRRERLESGLCAREAVHPRAGMIGAQRLSRDQDVLVPARREVFKQAVTRDPLTDVIDPRPRLSRARLVHAEATLVIECEDGGWTLSRQDFIKGGIAKKSFALQ